MEFQRTLNSQNNSEKARELTLFQYQNILRTIVIITV